MWPCQHVILLPASVWSPDVFMFKMKQTNHDQALMIYNRTWLQHHHYSRVSSIPASLPLLWGLCCCRWLYVNMFCSPSLVKHPLASRDFWFVNCELVHSFTINKIVGEYPSNLWGWRQQRTPVFAVTSSGSVLLTDESIQIMSPGILAEFVLVWCPPSLLLQCDSLMGWITYLKSLFTFTVSLSVTRSPKWLFCDVTDNKDMWLTETKWAVFSTFNRLLLQG